MSKDLNRKNSYWLFGKNTVLAAMSNPSRVVLEVWSTPATTSLLNNLNITQKANISTKIVDNKKLSALLGQDVLHQGIAARVNRLSSKSLETIIERCHKQTAKTTNAKKPDTNKHKEIKNNVIVALDQIHDGRNVGAVIRTSALMGVRAIVTTKRNFPQENAHIAKTSSGFLEKIDIVTVANLSNALKLLQKHNFFCFGLHTQAESSSNLITDNFSFYKNSVIVVGSEHKGLRQLTQHTCDSLIHIPVAYEGSLNLSSSLAMSLFAFRKQFPQID